MTTNRVYKGKKSDATLRLFGLVVAGLSFEFLLIRYRRANGGTIILVRALLTSLVLYGLAIGFKHAIDPTRSWHFSSLELRLELLRSFQWFGAIFAGVYAALYARFSSQFTYLANLYNQIKQAEVREAEKGSEASALKLCEWKAAFLEDAEVLHLSTKPIFASVISAWVSDARVQACYARLTPGGKARLDDLLRDVARSYEREVEKWKRSATLVAPVEPEQLSAPTG